ncbi:MAG: spore coat U domain-containing protein [Hyphomicrobiales bacterium]
MKHLKTILAGAALLAAGAGTASAATVTGNLNVALTLSTFCSMNASGTAPLALTFPTAANLTQPVGTTTAAILNVTCSAGTVYSIKLGNGLNKTGADRQLARDGGGNTENKVPYKLSRQANGVEEWVPDVAFTPTSPGSGVAQPFNIWGFIPATSAVLLPGTYKDTVVITLDY